MRVRRILKKFPFHVSFLHDIIFCFGQVFGVLVFQWEVFRCQITRWSAPSARFHNVDVFVPKDYDVFKEEYMYKSCIICIL